MNRMNIVFAVFASTALSTLVACSGGDGSVPAPGSSGPAAGDPTSAGGSSGTLTPEPGPSSSPPSPPTPPGPPLTPSTVLCQKYPENVATNSFLTFTQGLYASLAADCRVQGIFDPALNKAYDYDFVSEQGLPYAPDCFIAQLRKVKSCANATYDETTIDANEIACLSQTGASVVAGFLTRGGLAATTKGGGITDGDYDAFLDVVAKQVVKDTPEGLKYAAGDEKLLVAELEKLRSAVVVQKVKTNSASTCGRTKTTASTPSADVQ